MKSCEGCKYWSDRLAMSLGGEPIKAYCFNKQSANYSKYVLLGCDQKEEGTPIDAEVDQ